MATAIPPPATPLPAPSTGIALPTAIIQNPPQAFLELPVGSVVSAELMAELSKGTVEVKTDLGNILLNTSVKYTEGARLQLQILKHYPQIQVLLNMLSSDGQLGQGRFSVQAQPGQLANATAQVPSEISNPVGGIADATNATLSGLRSVSANGQIKLDIGAVVKATVLRIPAGHPSTIQPTQSPTQNSTARTDIEVPGPTPNKPTLATSMAQDTSHAKQTSNPGNADTEMRLQVGNQVDVRILGIIASGTSSATETASHTIRTGQIFQGSVTSVTPASQAIVDTSIGQLVLETKAHLPVGSRLSMEVVSLPGKGDLSFSITSGGDLLYLTRSWPQLEGAVNHLAAASSPAASQLTAPPIPQANSSLASNILFFLSALRGGDVSRWMDDQSLKHLMQDRPDATNRLSEEFAQLSRAFNDGPNTDWRTALIPFFNGAHLEQVQMHLRGQSGKQDNEGGSKETARFLIDVQLSRLGRIQLDGLIKDKGKKFDLIVRTEAPLSRIMRKDISGIFVELVEATGLQGGLVFQADNKFLEVPMPSFGVQGDRGFTI